MWNSIAQTSGNGMPQGAPQAPQAAPQAPPQQPAAQVPPDFARNVDPGNEMQMELIARIEQLTPQDAQAFSTGVSPQAVAVLKKVIPEVGFILDRVLAKTAGGGMAMPGPQQQAGAPPIPAPTSRLGQIQA